MGAAVLNGCQIGAVPQQEGDVEALGGISRAVGENRPNAVRLRKY